MDLGANGFSPEGAHLWALRWPMDRQHRCNATHARGTDQSRSCQAAEFGNSDAGKIAATKWSISLTYLLPSPMLIERSCPGIQASD